MKKKLLTIMVFAVSMAFVCLGLTACGGDGTGTAEAPEAEAPVVEAPTGTYTGIANDGVMEFKGIRYGEFTPFLPATDVTTTTEDQIDATEYGANCIQPYSEVEVSSQDPCSHDCLFLNIFTKDTATADKPVIFWIHGGGYTSGGESDPCYDAQYFVRNLPEGEDCVFITINYRYNFMGGCDMSILEGYTEEYAQAKDLSKLDQKQALKWVSENIEAWGGDPNNVTIMGHSSGGAAVQALYVDPECNKYFNRCIQNSGIMSSVAISEEQFAENSQTIFDILGVKSVDELTALSDKEINSKIEEICEAVDAGNRCADGVVTSKTWWDDFRNGSAKDIDLLVGSVNGEEDWDAIDWDNGNSEPIKDAEILHKMMTDYENGKPEVYGVLYGQDLYDEYLALGEFDSDVQNAMTLWNEFRAPYGSLLAAEVQSKNNENVWLYYWEYAPDKDMVLEYSKDAAEVSPWGRAMHTMDVCHEFGTKEGYTELTGDPAKWNDELTTQVQAAMYNFAKTGNPNGEGVAEWKPYNDETRCTMVVKEDGTMKCESNYRSNVYDLLRTVRPYGEQ